ncbi:hypothetical protein BpHYR1_052256 [Brachionus plicatilis]|uniref:Uncharacterized protein n=1 Tax=Brachionus plicatilis TaxID=10195 RepID=A0A3M7TAL3_BRAPC|nr:hypothetical protein BpHYR1_052256 [Brachionus plicatilis]
MNLLTEKDDQLHQQTSWHIIPNGQMAKKHARMKKIFLRTKQTQCQKEKTKIDKIIILTASVTVKIQIKAKNQAFLNFLLGVSLELSRTAFAFFLVSLLELTFTIVTKTQNEDSIFIISGRQNLTLTK